MNLNTIFDNYCESVGGSHLEDASRRVKMFDDIVNKLIDTIKERNLTIQAVAEKSGISEDTIGKMFRVGARFNPTLSTIIALADAIGLEVTIKKPNSKKK